MKLKIVCYLIFTALLSLSHFAYSKESTPYGEWVYVEDKLYKNIHTLNEHNFEFGYVCNNGCMFYITPSVICDESKVTDGWLIQTSGISKKVQAICIKHEGETLLKISSGTGFTDLLKKNNEIHFLINFDVETNSLLTFNMIGFIDSYNRIKQ